MFSNNLCRLVEYKPIDRHILHSEFVLQSLKSGYATVFSADKFIFMHILIYTSVFSPENKNASIGFSVFKGPILRVKTAD
jgi:hypothetical protein